MLDKNSETELQKAKQFSPDFRPLLATHACAPLAAQASTSTNLNVVANPCTTIQLAHPCTSHKDHGFFYLLELVKEQLEYHTFINSKNKVLQNPDVPPIW